MTKTAYDEKDYPYSVRSFSHPARLGVVARLYGRDAAPFERCRVLEIGGGDGINVVNMALAAPHSEFVNFDLSQSAIAQGRRLVAETGLHNMRQEAMDILAADDTLGEFDYIIAHGVYAWVPTAVRAALMALIGRRLSPRGIAMISYNTLPGCHIRRAVRDLVRQAAQAFTTPDERCAAARAALNFHCARWDPKNVAQSALLSEAKRLLDRPDGVIFHDELSDEWHPQFVADVAASARHVGLDFLGDTQLELIKSALFPGAFEREAAAIAGEDFVALEQARDFADVRAFRQTLLCRAGAPIERGFAAERLDGLWVDGTFAHLDSSDPGKPFAYRATNGGEIATSDARLAAMFARLTAAWPAAVAIDDVASTPDMREALAHLFVSGAVGLTTSPYPLCTTPAERPKAALLARVQASHGARDVTTLRHTQARLDDDLSRRFLILLDGTRTRAELTAAMAEVSGDNFEAAALKVEDVLDTFMRFGLIEA